MSAIGPLARLAWSRPLERRETASGYASRMAALNGRRLGVFLREMVVTPRDVDLGVETAVQAVATLGGVDASGLRRYTPVRASDERYMEVAGERLLRHSVHRTFFRFCPACVAEDLETFDGPLASRPWLRLEWTIAEMRSCRAHGAALVAASPTRRGFEPFDFAETVAAVLPDLPGLLDAATPSGPSPFADWIDRRLDGRRDPGNWLDAMPYYAAAALCEALGVSALHPPKVKTASLTDAQWAEAADRGYDIASRGPASLATLLAELNDAQRQTRGVWGPRDTFGYAYGLLQQTVRDPAYESVRAAVREFAKANMPLEPGSDLLGETVAARSVHTIHSAARAAGVHNRTMRTLLRRHGLAEGSDNLGDHRITVDAADLARMVDGLKDALTVPQVVERTGIHLIHLRWMIVQGYLETVGGTGSVANAKHRFTERAVDALVGRLFAGAEEVPRANGRRVPIMKARNMSHAPIETILKAVLDGALEWKGRIAGRSDYAALLVDADEITRMVRSEGPREGLTKQEVGDELAGVARNHVDRLVAAGHLAIVEEFSAEARRMIPVVSRASVEAFRKRYVTLGELTQRTGLHHKKVRLLLRGAGIGASLDTTAVGVFVYDREAVDGAVVARPGFWAYDKAAAQRAAR